MILILILLHILIVPCSSRTAADELAELGYGIGKILLGAYIGDSSIIAQGVTENGDINGMMTPFIGEKVLKLGKLLVNYPLSPALHLTFFHGQKDHLDTAFFMMNRGANPNKFELPSYYSEDFKYNYMEERKNPAVADNKYQKDNILEYLNISYGYPPAMMYCLGLGSKPTNSHAAFLQRIYKSLPTHFNLTTVEIWRNLTGNPPIVHIPILIEFFDGIYALVEDLKYDVNQVDQHGVSPLHIASWKGDNNLLLYLLSRGAAISSDIMGRTPLHYAAMRGHSDTIAFLLKSFNKKSDTKSNNDIDENVKIAGQRKQDVLKADLIRIKDINGRTALQLAALQPSLTTVIRPIRKEMTKLKILPEDRWSRAPKTEERNIDSISNSRGGWYYPNDKKNNDDDKADIDVIKAAKFSRKLFINDYFSTQRPVLVTDNLFSKQYIWLYWEKQIFINKYGRIIVRKGERLHSTEKNPWTLPQPETYTVKQYVEKYMNGCDDNNNSGVCYNNDKNKIDDYIKNPIADPWVAFTNNSEVFANDIKKPHALRVCGDDDNENIKLTLGPGGTGVPMHSHNASWNLLLTGKKKWFLIAPGQALSANDDDNNDFNSGKGAYNYHIKPTTEWLRDKAPALRSKGILHEVMQYPGDVLIIPHDWSHATLNLADTVAISQEFCTLRNTIHRIMPLGHIIYGSKDEFRSSGPISSFEGGDVARIERFKKELAEMDNVPQFDGVRV